MELWFLGTNAGIPTRERNVTSIALRISDSGTFWMFDCGEGTQHQLMQTTLKLNRLTKIFITHMHGDHVYGLPGLLSSRSAFGATEALHIYGPRGLREFVDMNLQLTETYLGYPIKIEEIEEEGNLLAEEMFKVETAKIDHRIDCYGYRIVERERPGTLNAEWLAEIGVTPGPIYGELKAGKDVTLDDGRVIRSADAVGTSIPGRIITILGDTRPCTNAIKLSHGADVLVHEATFAHTLAEKADEYGHSTALQAAQIAQSAHVKRLFLTHFSSRYTQDDLAKLEAESRTVFDNSDAALELKPYRITLSEN